MLQWLTSHKCGAFLFDSFKGRNFTPFILSHALPQDYLVCDALHTLVSSSLDDIAAALTPAPLPAPLPAAARDPVQGGLAGVIIESGSEATLAAPSASKRWGMPLLQVTLKFEESQDALVFEPSADKFVDLIAGVSEA